MKKLIDNLKNIPFPKELRVPALTLFIGLLLGYLITSSGYIPNPKNVNTKKAQSAVESYLKTLPLEDYKVTSVIEEGDLYKVSLTVNGRDYTSYLTKNGKILFPESIDLEKVSGETDNSQNQPAAANLPKNDKPVVELFVMSHCPYGIQTEKGILPVVDTLGDKIDFNIKFVDYAMHGEKEVREQMNQVCIQNNYPKDTYLSYVKCFLDAGDTESCIKKTNLNKTTISNCVSKLDSTNKIMATFNDKTKWNGSSYPPFPIFKADNDKYNVQGSPTLIINGVEADSGRSSSALLATICSAFNNAPEECNTTLDSATPSPSFGYSRTTTDASTSAVCN